MVYSSIFSLISPRAPKPTLFPYTTLFRSAPTAELLDEHALEALVATGDGFTNAALAAQPPVGVAVVDGRPMVLTLARDVVARSEEHTSELQSQFHLVCRLLLEKKNKNTLY